MPLPPLDASNTKRYFVLWTIGGTKHHTQVRVIDAIDNATAVLAFQNDFSILLPDLGDNVFIDGLEVAENGSDIRNAVSGWTTLQGTSGLDCLGQFQARTFSLRGRSSSGRKVKMLLWGFVIGRQDDFQLNLSDQTTGQSDFMTQVQARFNAYLTIDGSPAVWRTDYLEDYNDHWEKELRP